MSVKLNITSQPDDKLTISPDAVPTLIPDSAWDTISDGDENPYFKLQEIQVPIVANGYNYTKKFFSEFLAGLKDRPYPGSKYGHDLGWGTRPATDLYLVGGKLSKGKIYLKNYIPPIGETGDNELFIKQNRIGMIHYSLVAETRDEIKTDSNGNRVLDVVGYVSGGRNDAVAYNDGAMKQKTNAETRRIMSRSRRKAEALLESGDVDDMSGWDFTASDGNTLLGPEGDNWREYSLWHLVENTGAEEETKDRYMYPYGKGGKIYLSALRAIASRGAQAGDQDVSDWASEQLDKYKQKQNSKRGGRRVYDEIIEKLLTLKINGEVAITDIAAKLGIPLVEERHAKALSVQDELRGIVGEDIVGGVKALAAYKAESEVAVVRARLTEEFGAEEETNLVRQHANSMMGLMQDGTLDERIAKIKANAITAKLLAEAADYTSRQNLISAVKATDDTGNDRIVMKL